MLNSGLLQEESPVPASSAPATPYGLTAAFMLPPEMFELLYGDECLAAVGALARLAVILPVYEVGQSEAWARQAAEVEVLFTGWNSPILDERLLRQLPRLRVVFHSGGTLRPYLTDAFWDRGITVSTAAAANAIPVAEFTLGAILLSLKQAWGLHRQVRNARNFPPSFPSVPGVHGSTIGLVSLGLIGQAVLKHLRAFDVRVIGHDPYLPAASFRKLGVESVSLAELMTRSDVVSLHTPLHSETLGFITGELLRLLKPGATIINTARGALIRESELVAFLRERPDVQAILDVTSPEPPDSESPLYDLANVFMTPHIAGSLGHECRRLGWTMIEEFWRYQRGEPLLHTVSRELVRQQT